MNKLYITTAIPYVNARPHVGFALELVQADVIARFRRLLGWNVRFQTGTDENATKNVFAAEEQGLPTEALVNQNAAVFRNLVAALDVSADEFIRTTEARHRLGVEALWGRLRIDDVYRADYRGLYCVGCEDFISERDLVGGICPDHATKPAEVSESNYFFRLSAYQDHIEDLVASGKLAIVPEVRRNEVLSFIRRGLADISISRPVVRARGWGIRVPGDPDHIVYVWIDALVNYVSGLGFGSCSEWSDWWQPGVEKLHVIGKNVWKFHAIYWPALLLSAGLPLPNKLVVHGFVTVDGQKVGKSLGNAIDPFDYISSFGCDAVRYYLLRSIPTLGDGDFSAERFRQLYNTDLANGLGNLASRIISLCTRARFVPQFPGAAPDAPAGYLDAIAELNFDKALGTLWALVTDLNREIDQVKPWELLDSAAAALLPEHLARWCRSLWRVSYWLQPFLPPTAARLHHRLLQPAAHLGERLFPRV